jgi:hypothetical protein
MALLPPLLFHCLPQPHEPSLVQGSRPGDSLSFFPGAGPDTWIRSRIGYG